MEVLDLTGKENKPRAEAAKICGENKSSIGEVVQGEKETHASFYCPISNCKIPGPSGWGVLARMERR